MRKLICLFALLITPELHAQLPDEVVARIKQDMEFKSPEIPGLEKLVDISVSGIPVGDFVRAVAEGNGVNVSVSPDVKGTIVNNFSGVTVADILIFLAIQYELDITFTGTIIFVKPFDFKAYQTGEPKTRYLPWVEFDPDSSLVSYDLKQDTLSSVTRLITQLSGRNLVFAPGLDNKLLSGYLQCAPFDEALDKLAFANSLNITKTPEGYYLIEAVAKDPAGGDQRKLVDKNPKKTRAPEVVELDSGIISIRARSVPIQTVVDQLLGKLGLQYFLFQSLDGNITLEIDQTDLDEILERLFLGTKYGFKKYGDVYLFGDRQMEGLKETRRIALKYRSVEKLSESLPQDVMKDLEIKEFQELNSYLVSGPFYRVKQFENLLSDLDQSVPVVSIEVIIVDYNRQNLVSSGIQAGIGEQPVTSGGTLYPELNYTLGAQSINKIIESFDGFGTLNLGKVTPNFYVNLRLLESNGIINMRSTPRLSTLNGHEAELSIGNTEYYAVEQTNIVGVQNPVPVVTKQYQSVQANLIVRIKPIVSGDGQVTLEIEVEQSDFTARISKEAPPGQVTRKFVSMIRVKNEEMILLGGLEEKGYNDSGDGVPVLSRIPVLRWLFSSRNRQYNKTRLNVFIRPTIIE